MSPVKKKKPINKKEALLGRKLRESKETVRKLKHERNILLKALDTAGVGVILEDREQGKWDILNRTVSRITGYSPEDISTPKKWMRKLCRGKSAESRAAQFTERPKKMVCRITRESGAERTIMINTCPVATGIKGVTRTLNVISDKTEMVGLKKYNDRCKEWVAKSFDHTIDGVCVLDSKMRVIRINNGVFSNHRFDTRRIVGRNWFDFVPPEHKEQTRKFFNHVIRDEPVEWIQTQVIDKKGQKIDVEICAVQAKDPEGYSNRIIVNVHDIAGMKGFEADLIRQAQQLETLVDKRTNDLRKSEENFRLFLGNLSDIAYRADRTGAITYANNAASTISGFPLQEIIGTKFIKFFARESRKQARESFQSVLSGRSYDVELTFLNGKTCQFKTEPFRDRKGNITGIFGIARDVTEHKRVEEQAAVFQALTENAIDSISMGSSEGKHIYGNRACYNLFGYDYEKSEMTGMNITSFWPEEDASVLTRDLLPQVMTGPWQREVRQKRKDGTIFYALLAAFPMKSKTGRFIGIAAIIRDITERKQTTKALQESENRHRTTIDSMKEAIHVVDSDLRIVLFNEALMKWCDEFGFGRNLRGKTIFEAFPFLHNKVRDEYDSVFQSGRSLVTDEFNRIGNREIFTEVQKIPVQEAGKTVRVITIVRDITQQRKSEISLNYRMGLETILTSISATLIEIPPEKVDEEFSRALQILGEYLGIERSYISLISEDGTRTSTTHQRCAKGTHSLIKKLKNLPRDVNRWTIEKLGKGEIVHVPSAASLPSAAQNEKRLLLKLGIKSFVSFPMALGGKLLGFYGFASSHEKTWNEGDLAILRTCAEIFVNALERKRREEKLRESEAKNRAILHAMPDLMFQISRDGIFLNSEGTREELYLHPNEFLGRNVRDILPPDVAELTIQSIEQTLLTGEMQIFEYQLQVGGHLRQYEARMAVSDENTVLSIVREITERKRAEQALRHRAEIEKLLASISTQFINVSSGMMDTAMDSAIDVLAEFAGAERAYVYLISDDKKTMKNTHEWCAEGITPQISKGKDLPVEKHTWTLEKLKNLENIYIHRIADLPPRARPEKERFKQRNIKSSVAVPMALKGSLLGFFSFDTVRTDKIWAEEDIAIFRAVGEVFVSAMQRKKVEAKLRESENNALALLNANDDIMLLLEADGTLIAVNNTAERMIGQPAVKLVGSRIFDFFSEGIKSSRAQKAREVVRSCKPVRYEDTNSAGRIFDTTLYPILDDSGKVVRFAVASRDVTDRKHLEQQLLVSAKLASLGQFVAGIAHEINNPLASIKLDMQRLRKKALLAKDCDNILGTIGRITQIVSNLLKYARGHKTALVQNNIQKIIESALELVRERFSKENKRILTEFGSEKALVFSDFGQIQQVFLNLMLNACDAMKKNGTLRIDTSYLSQSKEVKISFRDDGKGIAKKDIARVFDPFFTTRNSGTGLGLAITHKIIENHNGKIEIMSQLGQGTEVIVVLPATKKEDKTPKRKH